MVEHYYSKCRDLFKKSRRTVEIAREKHMHFSTKSKVYLSLTIAPFHMRPMAARAMRDKRHLVRPQGFLHGVDSVSYTHLTLPTKA